MGKHSNVLFTVHRNTEEQTDEECLIDSSILSAKILHDSKVVECSSNTLSFVETITIENELDVRQSSLDLLDEFELEVNK